MGLTELTPRIERAVFSLEALGEDVFPSLFQLLG